MTQLSNKPEYEKRPSLALENGRRVHYTDHDWDKIISTKLEASGSQWPVGQLMKHARDLQATALYDFNQAGEKILKMMGNKDLTHEAKQRYAKEAMDHFAENVDKHHAELAKAMESMAAAAQTHFQPVRPLEKGDAVGVAMDAELRAVVRSMDAKERMALLNEAKLGNHPELTAALLRAPALASGITQATFEGLRNAGIVAAYGSDIGVLRELMLVHDDVVRTASNASQQLQTTSGVNHSFFSRLSRDTASDVRGWISSLPSLPSRHEQPAREVA